MKLRELTPRERRAIGLLAVCTAVFTAISFWPEDGGAVVGPAATVEQLEQRIQKLRRLAAAAPGREAALEQVRAELARREQGMLQAETAAQAQARMLEMVRRLAKDQDGFALRGTEFGAPRPLGDDYGEVTLTVNAECRIEQLITFLVDVANQPELVAVSELQLSQAAEKSKVIPARITLTAVVPRSLAPEKKGGPAY